MTTNDFCNKKTILIIEPVGSGLGYIPAAKDLGLKVYVFSANRDDRIIPYSYKKQIDKLFILDTNNLKTVKDHLYNLLKVTSLEAIIPGFEYFVDYIYELYDLVNLSPPWGDQANLALRDKAIAREILRKQHFNVPVCAKINQSSDLKLAAKKVSFPSVFKPTKFGGSIHVSKVHNLKELEAAYHAMNKDAWTELGNEIGDQAILESYLSGPEYSVEGFVNNDRTIVVTITEKLLSKEPYFVEVGHITPASVDLYTQTLIEQYIAQVIHALGVHFGAFHSEVKLTCEGPVLIEIAGRPAGDHICDLIELATGINFYKQVLCAFLNKFFSPPNKPSFQYYAGICFFMNNKSSGYLKEIKGTGSLTKLPGFFEFKQTCQDDEFVPNMASIRSRVGYVVFVNEDHNELSSSMHQAHAIIEVITEDI